MAALASSWRTAVVRLNGWAARRPLLTAATAGGAKYIGCDVLVQHCEGQERLDRRRVGAFAAFGTFYAGGVQYLLFNRLLPWCLPLLQEGGRRAPASVVAATGVDVFVHMPFFYLPTFYTIRELAFRPDTPSKVLANAWAHYREGFGSDARTSLVIFGPIQLLNFGFSPTHLRVPVLLASGLLWTAILSTRRGRGQ